MGDRRQGKVGRGQEEKRTAAAAGRGGVGVGEASSDHQHNKSDPILAHLSLAPFFCNPLFPVSSQEESEDDSQGTAVALLDLIDEALLRLSEAREAHFLLFTPQRLAQATQDRRAQAFPAQLPLAPDGTVRLPSAGRRLLTLRTVGQ